MTSGNTATRELTTKLLLFWKKSTQLWLFDKCSESVTRQKSIKKKTKFNIIWLKMYISGLVTTLFYKSFDFTYNTVILDQKCHQICTFWARKWWFLAFFKLFCQMAPKHLVMLSEHLPKSFGQDYVWCIIRHYLLTISKDLESLMDLLKL